MFGEMEVAFLLMLALPVSVWLVFRPRRHWIRLMDDAGQPAEWSEVDGFDVPRTNGVLFVFETERGWRITHRPSGYAFSFIYLFSTREKAIEAAEWFWLELTDEERRAFRSLSAINDRAGEFRRVYRATIKDASDARA